MVATRKSRSIFSVYDVGNAREFLRADAISGGARIGIGGAVDSAFLLSVNGNAKVAAQSATDIGLVVQAAASQSANLHEWHSSAGAIYSTISENGYATTRKVAAPADGELSASECAYWFDDTNGAARFVAKGKTADGTVVTGSFALS